jgi:hypothetical protein
MPMSQNQKHELYLRFLAEGIRTNQITHVPGSVTKDADITIHTITPSEIYEGRLDRIQPESE